MTPEDSKHCTEIVNWFSREAAAKYRRGTVEHGGYLPRKGGLLAEAENEVLDLAVYVRTIRSQIQRAYDLLARGDNMEGKLLLYLMLHGTPADVMGPDDIWGK